MCPPCGEDCHDLTFDESGNCSMCGMGLVKRSSILSVGVLVFEGVDVLSTTAPLAIFAAARANVFTVADTTDPVRCETPLTIVPKYALADAPPIDVLIIPSGFAGVWDDELVMEWVTKTAMEADQVLGIGAGSLILAKTGLLEADAPVAGPAALVQRGATLVPGVTYTADEAMVRHGAFVTARDAAAAIDVSFEMVLELVGEAGAQRAFSRLGYE